jgi:cell filamentation protein
VFDPFKDFDTKGYLRNRFNEKDLRIIKRLEHQSFTLHLPLVIQYLSKQERITYANFLAVHNKLFTDVYPWAGKDRAAVAADSFVSKGEVRFAHPADARKAVEEGLRLGSDPVQMAKRPGEIMGLFAFGHPFLDGNGRTMLLVHLELCYRARFSIDWSQADKADYLSVLTQEIDNPGKGILDTYLLAFKGERTARDQWGESVASLRGLDGLDEDQQLDGAVIDSAAKERYREFEAKRDYQYKSTNFCPDCNAAPCQCKKI